MTAAPEPVAAKAPPPQPVRTASPASISRDDESAGMQRAEQFLKNADIAGARLMFENLALRGSAQAAFAMGQTYDPEFLKTLVVQGLRPDVEQAKSWYRKALELGSPEASGRLSALGQTIR
jgi:TPR repeat protein